MSRPFLFLNLSHQRGGWGCPWRWETQPGQWPHWPWGQPRPYKAGKRRRKGGHSQWWYLSSQVTARHHAALTSWAWLKPACFWKVMNQILFFALMMCKNFAFIFNCLNLKPWVFSLLLFRFPPSSCCRAVSEWHMAELLARVKSWCWRIWVCSKMVQSH